MRVVLQGKGKGLQEGELVGVSLVEAPGVLDTLGGASLIEADEAAFEEECHLLNYKMKS